MMRFTIVVPVYNEMDNVAPLIAEIASISTVEYQYEIIFIDDGSSDQTLAQLKAEQNRYPELRVLHHQQSYGQSRAIHTGVKAARYPWIATLDGDGQNDPTDIPKLIEVLNQQGSDQQVWMLAGYRHQRNDTYWRRFSSRLANTVRQAVLKDQTPDTGCGLKLFRRDKFLALPYFDHMHRFLPALIKATGGQVISVKVSHRPRQRGQSKYGTLDRLIAGIIDLLGVVWLVKRQSKPVIEEFKHE